MRRKLSFANVTALMALFFALSAGAYAGIKLPANSVTSKQVKNGSLLKADFKRGQLARGPQGPAGAAGPAGAQGAQGPQGPPGPANTANIQVVEGPEVGVCAFSAGDCAVATSSATCPAGTHAIGGGSFEFTGGLAGRYEGISSDRTAWFVGVANGSEYGGGYVQAVAHCVTTGSAVAAKKRSTTAATKRDLARVEARLRVQLDR